MTNKTSTEWDKRTQGIDTIRFFNRYTHAIEEESVYGLKPLRWIYCSFFGKLTLWLIVKRKFFSWYYGRLMSKRKSASRIAPFIKQYGLDENDFLESIDTYQTFNDFFYRKLKSEVRLLDRNDQTAIFPADGRHLGWQNVSEAKGFYIKGQKFDVHSLLADKTLGDRYQNGSIVISRLCPVDYHRFHFAANGKVSAMKDIDGSLFSVNPIALAQRIDYFWRNKRSYCEIDSPEFGKVIQFAVGATCVGGIETTYGPGTQIEKGDEMGYFKFGGSCIITIFEPNRITLAKDLTENTAQGLELYAHFGDLLGAIVE